MPYFIYFFLYLYVQFRRIETYESILKNSLKIMERRFMFLCTRYFRLDKFCFHAIFV